MTIALQNSVVYGPIRSRRLGVSLGINIFPADVKFCLSNCIYCQYGWTDLAKVRQCKLPGAPELLGEIEREFAALSARESRIDCITFSGNGEPTLHPRFGQLVQGVKELRDRFFPGAEVGALSDSTRAFLPEVKAALLELDRRYMKLDAGDSDTYLQINNPAVNFLNFDFGRLVESLTDLKPLVLQSLFITAPVDNVHGRRFENWLWAVVSIKPEGVHLYTVARSTADSRVQGATWDELLNIERRVRARVHTNTVVCGQPTSNP